MSGNYGFVVDSSYDPFSLQEMLVPFTAYKEEYEKSEAAYQDLTDKADTFKYLSEKMPEGSKARQIYEGYANDLKDQAIDLAQNGYSMNNRRALTSMKRRYSGEIGRLVKADEAMETEKKLRQSLNAQDSSRLYAIDNLDIDQFLDGNNPNLYNISGNELYTRGAAAGKAASSRIFSAGDRGSTLNGYYRDYVQAMGYNADTIRKFREDMSAIPELQMEADAILQERGVLDNLTGVNLQRARQSVINGMIDGAVYNESHSPTRDPGVLSAKEKIQNEMAEKSYNLQKSQLERQFMGMGYRLNDKGEPYYDEELAKHIQELKGKGKDGSGSAIGSEYTTINKKPIKLSWHGNNPNDTNGDADNDITSEEIDGSELSEIPVTYDSLPSFVKNKISTVIGDGNINLYRYYYTPFKRGWLGSDSGNWSIFNDQESEVTIVPVDVIKYNDTDPEFSFLITDQQGQK
jgi:hypothetical protein